MSKTMSGHDRFQALMNFQPVDRLPIIEWASWWGDATLARWHQEGLPTDLDQQELYRYFGMDVHYQDWVGPCTRQLPLRAHHGAPLIRSVDEYEAARLLLYPEGPLVDATKWRDWARRQKQDGDLLWFTLNGFFWHPRILLGIEPHLYAFYDHPELMHRMNQDITAFNLRVIDEICSICTPDFMTFAEDLSYNNGPMLSEEQFDEFLLPYYQCVVPRLKEHGVKVFVDSDGDITKPGGWFQRAGLEGVLPLERQAGVDIAKLRELYPRQLYIGAYDKMVMPRGEAAMRAEFERLMPVARQGGFAISVDHQTPPGVSLENYRIFIRLFHDYAAKI